MKSVCVFSGASLGNNSPEYLLAVKALAKEFYHNNISLVYGGGSLGLMGALAQELFTLGGQVTGIIPETLAEIAGPHIGQTTILTKDMHERKKKMSLMADAFIALTGGFGTLEETFEMTTWNQLGIHAKPIALVNISGYYDCIRDWVDSAVKAGFIRESHKDCLLVVEKVVGIMEILKSHIVPEAYCKPNQWSLA